MSDKDHKNARQEDMNDAKITAGVGVGIGAYGGVLAATTGTICPVCVIATPALLGYGYYKYKKAKSKEE